MEWAYLVMNVVVVSVVATKRLQRVEREGVSTMIVDGLDGCNYEQKCSLTERHPRHPLGHDGTARIEKEAFNGVVILCTVCIRYIQPVMPRVERLKQEFIHVHGTMEEVLPSVDEEAIGRVTRDGEANSVLLTTRQEVERVGLPTSRYNKRCLVLCEAIGMSRGDVRPGFQANGGRWAQ